MLSPFRVSFPFCCSIVLLAPCCAQRQLRPRRTTCSSSHPFPGPAHGSHGWTSRSCIPAPRQALRFETDVWRCGIFFWTRGQGFKRQLPWNLDEIRIEMKLKETIMKSRSTMMKLTQHIGVWSTKWAGVGNRGHSSMSGGWPPNMRRSIFAWRNRNRIHTFWQITPRTTSYIPHRNHQ